MPSWTSKPISTRKEIDDRYQDLLNALVGNKRILPCFRIDTNKETIGVPSSPLSPDYVHDPNFRTIRQDDFICSFGFLKIRKDADTISIKINE